VELIGADGFVAQVSHCAISLLSLHTLGGSILYTVPSAH
jgi:hypothetical protein